MSTGKKSKTYTDDERRRFVEALNALDAYWLKVFKQDFYDMNYSDLFTELWRRNEPVTKMQACQFIHQLGSQTSKKYIDRAIEMGYLVESPNPLDGRSKLIELSPEIHKGLAEVIDYAIGRFRDALNDIGKMS
jgi:hypothetical protein